jgi:hypothetical protein
MIDPVSVAHEHPLLPHQPGKGFACLIVRELPRIPVIALQMPFKCLDSRIPRKRQNDALADGAGEPY